MKRNISLKWAAILIVIFLSFTACTKQPFKADFKNIAGRVIGNESCSADPSKDYWLLDCTVESNTPQVGDTLVINGFTYTNALKVKGLSTGLQKNGLRVSIDYKVISTTKIATTGCNITNPITYNLKEIFIINHGEIR